MALTQAGVVTGRRVPRRLGAYTAEMARTMMPPLTSLREDRSRFEEQQALEQEQLRLAEKGQKQGHQDVRDANKIALGSLGVTTLLGAKRYEALNKPATDVYTAEGPPAQERGALGRGGYEDYDTGSGGQQTGGDQPWYSKLGDRGTTAQPYVAGFGGGLLGSQLGAKIAGKKNKRTGKVAGGAVGGACH